MSIKSESAVSPRLLMDNLANVARGPEAFITPGTNLSGAQTTNSVFFFIKFEKVVSHPAFNRV